MTRLELIGGGRMGEALVGGLLRVGWAEPHDLSVVELVESRRSELVDLFPGVRVSDSPGPADASVVAVKPNDIPAACRAAAGAGTGRLLSVAAGVPLSVLESNVGEGVPVVRAMPNTPALVGVGASALAGGSTASESDLQWAEQVLGAVGTTVRVPERLLDSVTGLSGSGPAYVFLMIEAMIEAGVLEGLPRPVAGDLAVQTVLGAARLLEATGQSGADAAAQRAAVTSPGGTTAAGLAALEERGVRSAVVAAVSAAAARSRELG